MWTSDDKLAYDMKNEFDSAAISCTYIIAYLFIIMIQDIMGSL